MYLVWRMCVAGGRGWATAGLNNYFAGLGFQWSKIFVLATLVLSFTIINVQFSMKQKSLFSRKITAGHHPTQIITQMGCREGSVSQSGRGIGDKHPACSHTLVITLLIIHWKIA